MGLGQSPNRRWRATSAAITAATSGNSSVESGLAGAVAVGIYGRYTSTSGGTSVNAYAQTSFDSGSNWIDMANFMWSGAESGAKFVNLIASSITTAIAGTSGTLSANTVKEGPIGDQIRVYHTTTGSATGGTLLVNFLTKGSP
jgi:hypothetical protein